MKFLLAIFVIIFGSISFSINAKPLYLKCEYVGYIECDGTSSCLRTLGSKETESALEYLKTFKFNDVSYYSVHQDNLYDGKFFSLNSKNNKSIIEDFKTKNNALTKNNSTYEYFDINLEFGTKGKYYEYTSIYINRFTGQYHYYNNIIEGKLSNQFENRYGICSAIKYSRKF